MGASRGAQQEGAVHLTSVCHSTVLHTVCRGERCCYAPGTALKDVTQINMINMICFNQWLRPRIDTIPVGLILERGICMLYCGLTVPVQKVVRSVVNEFSSHMHIRQFAAAVVLDLSGSDT